MKKLILKINVFLFLFLRLDGEFCKSSLCFTGIRVFLFFVFFFFVIDLLWSYDNWLHSIIFNFVQCNHNFLKFSLFRVSYSFSRCCFSFL